VRPDRTAIHVSAVFSLLVGTAIAIGLADAALIASLRLGAAGAFQYIPPRLWVIAPLCWVAATSLIALASFAVSRRYGAQLTLIGAIVLFAAVRLRDQSTMRIIAGAIATIAVCAIGAWIARRWLARRRRPAVVAIAAMLAVVIAAAATAAAGDDAEPAPHASPRTGASPDVLLVVLDTVSHDAVFPNGRDVDPRFPNLARLARSGVVFDRAYTTAPWTLPAHFSAVTGLPAHDLGVDFEDQQYNRSIPTLAQRFRRDGYRTAAVISNTFLNHGSGFGRGFDTFEQAGNALDVCRTAPGLLLDRYSPWFAATVCNWSAREVTDRALAHVTNTRAPLFLLLNYMDAHDPYYVEADCRAPGTEVRAFRDVPPAAYRREYYANHLDAIRCIDRHLGRLFARMRNDAVIAVVADHGEQFGEHGLVRHGNSVYDQLLRVPLIIAGPRVTPQRVTQPLSLTALPQLIAAASEGKPFASAAAPVISFLAGSAATGGIEHWSVVRGRWHFLSKRGAEELYDLATDPDERHNRVRDGAAAPLLDRFRADLATQRRFQDRETERAFRSLGYVN
jgi:arylsulfatase A-like enzyme